MTAPSRVLRAGGLYFGGDAYVEVNDSPELNPEEWTIIAWIKHSFPVGQNIGYYPFILSKGRAEMKGYWLVIRKLDQKFTVGTGDGTTYAELVTEQLDNNWHMVVGQLKGNELIAYVDLNKYTRTLDFTPVVSTRNIIIGMHDSLLFPYRGFINNLRIYNIALSQSQIWELYKNPYAQVEMEHCVLWLPFTEHEGDVAHDYSGYGNHGTIYNARWVIKKPLRVLTPARVLAV